ncbi:MAG: ATPase, T2SS/T4P/T4SS family [Pseudomonadota bacterium]
MNTSSFSAKPSMSSSPKRYRLLLVDDDELLLEALKYALSHDHYDIVTCDDPHKALAMVKGGAFFHLIISDYMMPSMNGGELLKQMRILQPSNMRILLTAHSDVNAVVNAVKAGAVYKFILKPWNDEEIRLTIALALQQYELMEKNASLQREKQESTKEIEQLAKFSTTNRNQLAFVLNKKGLLSGERMRELLNIQSQRKDAVAIKILIEREWISEEVIHRIIRDELKFTAVDLKEYKVDVSVAALMPSIMCQRQLVVPLSVTGKRLTLAMADPLDTGLIENLRFVTGLEVIPVLALMSAIQDKINDVYKIGQNTTDIDTAFGTDPYEGIEIVIDDNDDVSFDNTLQGDEPPAIRFVNSILLEAIRLKASDIHIQPRAKDVAVRLRIDGVLIDKFQIPYSIHQSIVSRIKIMAELDISERRRPQDGRITVKTPKRVVDLRISTLPTINGEKVVMRILDRNSSVLSLDALGFGSNELEKIYEASDKPQGIILATGPTGSGKTTTLYSLLNHTTTPDKNYVTIEDPVEYYLDSAGQVLVKEKIGLTFPLILRSVLRQDPDVIMIGEIRDFETAEVAFHAASTGHQVYSTLHTNSAFDTLSRLFDLGLKPFVISSALQGIIAQRLVRRICEECSEVNKPDALLLQRLKGSFLKGMESVCKGTGCKACNQSGYKGRVGIYEVLVLDDHMRHLISNQTPIPDILHYAQSKGFTLLRDDAYHKVMRGLTTLEEIYRVIGPG